MNARKVEKLWRFRYEAAERLVRAELSRCQDVLFGGDSAKRLDPRLGLLGALSFRGSFEEWQAWKSRIEEYARERKEQMQRRLLRLRAIRSAHSALTGGNP